MPRYEVRFYDAHERVKVAVELDGPDCDGAEQAARAYLRHDAGERVARFFLVFGAVRELGR